MIYTMAREIGEALAAQKYPVRVVYGPERTSHEQYNLCIVLERDRTQSDVVRAVTASKVNPRRMRVRDLAVSATIYACSSLSGANVWDHERLCEQIVDAFLIALAEWIVAGKAGVDAPITEARYLNAGERDDVEAWPGVVYVLRFRVPRSVDKRTFEGEARPTGTLTGFANTTLARAPGYDPETGCGG